MVMIDIGVHQRSDVVTRGPLTQRWNHDDRVMRKWKEALNEADNGSKDHIAVSFDKGVDAAGDKS
jgi:hypothetical protein